MQRITRWIIGLALIVVLLLVLAAGVALYTVPVGSGEYGTSANQQYCARATSFTQRRLFAPARVYQAYEISAGSCEGREGQRIWQAEYEPPAGTVLDYGMRGERFITWSSADDEVTFVLDTGRSLTIPVP